MNILALDLGTKTGYAYFGSHATWDCGTWRLADPGQVTIARREGWDRKCDPRFATLCFHIESMIENHDIGAVVFEDVLFSQTTLQTQLWSTFRAAIWAVKRSHNFEIDCLNTATLKKVSTGHGAATKKMMAAHLMKKYPDYFFKRDKPTENCFLQKKNGEPVDDNAVDARHLLDAFAHLS